MNDHGKPQDDPAQPDERARELTEQLNLLEAVDQRITPEHVAQRFHELLRSADPSVPEDAGKHPRKALDQPGHRRRHGRHPHGTRTAHPASDSRPAGNTRRRPFSRPLPTQAGDDPQIADKAPGERRKFESLGRAILIIGGVAVVSMWFVLAITAGPARFFASTAGLLTSIAVLLVALSAIIAQIVTLSRKPSKDQKAVRLKKILGEMLNGTTAAAVTLSLGAVIILIARTPPQCRPTLTITSPAAGAVVDASQTVTGTVTCLSSGQHAWLILQPGGPGGGGYFPQDEVPVTGSTWSTTVYFGQQSAADDGRPFTILAVIANDTADQRFRTWLASGEATGSYPALADLTGATIVSQVKVIRGTDQGP